jgi:hypothetical protein
MSIARRSFVVGAGSITTTAFVSNAAVHLARTFVPRHLRNNERGAEKHRLCRIQKSSGGLTWCG